MYDDKMGLGKSRCSLCQGLSLRRHNPRPSSRCSGGQKGLRARPGESGAVEHEQRQNQRQSFWWAARCGEIQFLRQWAGLGWAGLTVLPWFQGAESAGAVRLQGAGPCPLEGESGPSSTFFLVLVLVLAPFLRQTSTLRKRSWRGTRVTWSHSARLVNAARLFCFIGPETRMAGRTGEPFQPADSSMRTWALHNRPDDRQASSQGPGALFLARCC